MTDRDLTPFETRLATRLRSASAIVVAPIDPSAVAQATMIARRGSSIGLRWRRLARPARLAVLGLLIAALLATAAAFVGSRLATPARPLSWTTETGPLIYGPRTAAASVVLRDGKVLVIGGTPAHRAELWDPATGRFSAIGEATIAGDDPAAVLLGDGRVLIVTAEARAAELYDPTTGAFSTTGAMQAFRARCHCGVSYMRALGPRAALLADGRVLVTGGLLAPSSSGEAQPHNTDVFDPQTGMFSPADTSCDAARGATATLADGRILVTCVTNSGGQSTQAQVFDPQTNAFTTTGSPTSIDNEFAFLLKDGRVLLSGEGRSSGRGAPSHGELYDAATGTFSPVPGDNPTVRSPGVGLADGRVLFLGEAGNFSWVFDPIAGRFTRVLAGVSLGVSGTPTLLHDGLVLVIGEGATATVLDPRLIP